MTPKQEAPDNAAPREWWITRDKWDAFTIAHVEKPLGYRPHAIIHVIEKSAYDRLAGELAELETGVRRTLENRSDEIHRLNKELFATREQLALVQSNTVPRSRYDVVCKEVQEADDFVLKVQANAKEEIVKLRAELEQAKVDFETLKRVNREACASEHEAYEQADKLATALMRSRGQWIHSVNALACQKALTEYEALKGTT